VATEDLPEGVVTFLFTDLEASNTLSSDLGESLYSQLRDKHFELLLSSIELAGGVVVSILGDGCLAVFASPADAVYAAVAAQKALHEHNWPPDGTPKVRMGLHTGSATLTNGDYRSIAVNQAARICSVARGGQILCSTITVEQARNDLGVSEISFSDLGPHRLSDRGEPERLYQIMHPDLPWRFPPSPGLAAPESPDPQGGQQNSVASGGSDRHDVTIRVTPVERVDAFDLPRFEEMLRGVEPLLFRAGALLEEALPDKVANDLDSCRTILVSAIRMSAPDPLVVERSAAQILKIMATLSDFEDLRRSAQNAGFQSPDVVAHDVELIFDSVSELLSEETPVANQARTQMAAGLAAVAEPAVLLRETTDPGWRADLLDARKRLIGRTLPDALGEWLKPGGIAKIFLGSSVGAALWQLLPALAHLLNSLAK
jgi:class 3 adenylate cyclase